MLYDLFCLFFYIFSLMRKIVKRKIQPIRRSHNFFLAYGDGLFISSSQSNFEVILSSVLHTFT